MPGIKLKIKYPLWQELILQLRIRGKGERESGALLLAKRDKSEIVRFICYDDLYPEAFDSGIVTFDSKGFIPLWKICASEQLMVVADIHTHPDKWVQQSSADIEHPIIHCAGHIALIVPSYAQGKHRNLSGIGICEYRGEYKWKTKSRYSGVFKIL